MKKITLIILVVFTSVLIGKAATFEEVMGQTIGKMYAARTATELTEISNQFNRIAEKETDKWLPGYYAAYSQVSILFYVKDLSNDQKKNYLDNAQTNLDKAIKIASNESEIYVLQGLIYQMRIFDPADGYQYSMMASEALKKAEIMNPDNPRVFYLQGTNTFHTPEQYGGGKAKAKPLFEKASNLFSQKPTNPLLPMWGKQNNDAMLEACK